MSVWTRLLHVLVFVLAYGAWMAGPTLVFKKYTSIRHEPTFWVRELALTSSTLGFFLFVFVVSGVWNFALVIFFLAAAQMGFIASYLLNAFFGIDSREYAPQMYCVTREQQLLYPQLNAIVTFSSVGLLLLYLVVGGFTAYRYAWSQQALSFLRYALLFLVTLFALQLMRAIPMLLSENMDEDTREHIFIQQLSTLVPTSLYVALTVWAFGVVGGGHSFQVPGVTQVFSLKVTWLVAALFAVVLIFPYALGTQRAKRYNLKLLDEKRDYLRKLVDVLDSPLAAQYVPSLTALDGQLAATCATLRDQNQMLQVVLKKDTEPVLHDDWEREFFQDFRTRDFRFKVFTELLAYKSELEEMIQHLTPRTGADLLAQAGLWRRRYKAKNAEIMHDIEGMRGAKPTAIFVLGTTAAGIISPVVGGVGTAVWKWIAGSVGK